MSKISEALEKTHSNLPANRETMGIRALAQALGDLNVLEPPPLPNNQSWLPRKFTKSKIRDLNVMASDVASIYESNTRALKARVDGAISLMTASDQLKLAFRKIEHEFKVMEHEEKLGEISLIKEQALAKIAISQAEEAHYSAKLTKLDYKMRLKDAKEAGYDIEDEDRD